MGNVCSPIDNAKDTETDMETKMETAMEPNIIRLSPRTIIRRVEVESIIKERELEKLCWRTKEVLKWMDMKGWSRYKATFLEKKVDGKSLADVRPLTLVRDLSVAPLDAFPFFNDITPLFRVSDFRVKDYELEFRRKVDLSWMDTGPEKRMNTEIAVDILRTFRGRNVELNDPALEYLAGVSTSEFLHFLRRPPTEVEQAIISGEDPLNLPLPQKVLFHRDGLSSEQKEDVCITIRTEEKVADDFRILEGKEFENNTKCRLNTNSNQSTTERKESLSLDDLDQHKPSEQTLGYLHEECPICLTAFDEGNDLMALPCAHLFCQSCITDWLSHDRRCPICQMNPDDDDLTMALLDSAFMACSGSLPNWETPEKGFISEALLSNVRSQTEREEEKNPVESLSRIRRASYQGPNSSYSPCALCEGPVNISKRHVRYDCGHVFHKRCSRATGLRGGCPFCSGPQVRATERDENSVPRPRDNSSITNTSTVWQVRRNNGWINLPVNIGQSLDAQLSQRQPTSEVVVFDEKRYEIRARERMLLDLSEQPPQPYRIRKLRGQGNRRAERSCSVM